MRQINYCVCLLYAIFLGYAPILAAPSSALDFMVYPLSTELQIGKLQKFLIDAPKGIYLTVGAERGFKAASMMPNITQLWLLDVADDILKFNQINTQLLKAPNRTTYLNLRWEA